MNVPGTFYVNDALKGLLFEELQQSVTRGEVRPQQHWWGCRMPLDIRAQFTCHSQAHNGCACKEGWPSVNNSGAVTHSSTAALKLTLASLI